MKILAIDTSGKTVSAAVAEDGRILAEYWLRHGKTHAEALMPCVDATLSGLDAQPGDMDAFAVICGPGSFTGLRIGIAAVKAFAYADGKRVAAIPTLDALAYNLSGYAGSLLCPVMDARNGNVYQALYRVYAPAAATATVPVQMIAPAPASVTDTTPAATPGVFASGGVSGATVIVRVADAGLFSAREAAQRVRLALAEYGGTGAGALAERVILNGDAAAGMLQFFRSALSGVSCVLAPEREMHQNAASAALLACEAAQNGRLMPPERLAPEYISESYANR
jgi:tRNA threonylcarbamoyl adenosine modification protein YeaZ